MRTVEPNVPVSNSTGTKYSEVPGAANHTKSLAVPGTAMLTGFDEIGTPVPNKPTSLVGAGLHVLGSQSAAIEATPGKLAVMDPPELAVTSMGFVDWNVSPKPVIVCPAVSITVVVRFCGTPCVTVPVVAPFGSVTLIEAGGQVLKYPADEADCAIDAVTTVVPGFNAVIWFDVALIVPTVELPRVKFIVPMVEVHDFSELRKIPLCMPPGQASALALFTTEVGAQSSY
jgi:hypothetical protein